MSRVECAHLLPYLQAGVKILESLTLNALGNASLLCNILLSVIANSYHGHSFQFTMGLIGFPVLCSFNVVCIFEAFGFMFTNFHVSSLFIMYLLLLMLLQTLFCNLFVVSCVHFVKLLVFMNSSIFMLYSFFFMLTVDSPCQLY